MSAEVVTRPRKYFIFHYLLFRFLGLGWWHQPEEEDTRNFPGWYLYYSIAAMTIWVVGFVALETSDPFIGEKKMDQFMFSLAFVVTHNLTNIKLSLIVFKNKEIQEIVRIIQLDLYEFYQNFVTNRKTLKITRIFSIMFISFGWMTIANLNVYGAVQDFHWRAAVKNLNDSSEKPVRNLPQPIYIPWNFQEDKSFILTFILQTTGLLWTGHIVLTIDTFIGSLILHMSSQFIVLGEAVMTAYDRTMAQLRESTVDAEYSPDENPSLDDTEENNEKIVRAFYTDKQIESALQTTLRNCFRQHQLLIGCVQKFATTYSYGFMTQLLSSLAAICAVMVQISQDASSLKSVRLVTSLAFFFAMITQLAIQCFTANELTLQAANISDAVMQSKWERMPARLRSQLLLMMMRAQHPIRLNATGFAYMDNDCFLAIMKAAYSYYAVLSQMQM